MTKSTREQMKFNEHGNCRAVIATLQSQVASLTAENERLKLLLAASKEDAALTEGHSNCVVRELRSALAKAESVIEYYAERSYWKISSLGYRNELDECGFGGRLAEQYFASKDSHE